jgi:hypothetical protein
MPESFIPVWMSIGEAEEFRRFLQEEARSTDGEFPEREYSLIDGALTEERPRTFEQMQAESAASTQSVSESPGDSGEGQSEQAEYWIDLARKWAADQASKNAQLSAVFNEIADFIALLATAQPVPGNSGGESDRERADRLEVECAELEDANRSLAKMRDRALEGKLAVADESSGNSGGVEEALPIAYDRVRFTVGICPNCDARKLLGPEHRKHGGLYCYCKSNKGDGTRCEEIEVVAISALLSDKAQDAATAAITALWGSNPTDSAVAARAVTGALAAASTQPPSPQAEVQDCERLEAALRWVRDFASEQMPEEEGLLAVVDEALAPAGGDPAAEAATTGGDIDDQEIEALAKARRERGRGDTLPWDELPEIAKGPIRKEAAEDLRNGTGKQPPAEPQGDVVEALAKELMAETTFGGRYGGPDGWETFKRERPSDTGLLEGRAERLLGAVTPLLRSSYALEVRQAFSRGLASFCANFSEDTIEDLLRIFDEAAANPKRLPSVQEIRERLEKLQRFDPEQNENRHQDSDLGNEPIVMEPWSGGDWLRREAVLAALNKEDSDV